MKILLSFIISFVVIYLFYLLTVILNKKKHEKYMRSRQVMFFVRKYNLDFKKVSFTKIMNIIALTNSFIMSTTIVVLEFVPNLFMKLIVAFACLMVLIMACYKLIGIYIERRK